MLYSRVEDKEFRNNIPHNQPRETFTQVLNNVIDKLSEQQDTGISKIYKLIPNKDSDVVLVLGFSSDKNQIVAIDEESIGWINGNLEPILNEDQVAECICGQLPVIRLPEDEENGKKVRTRTHKNAIKLDPFLTLGKEFSIKEVEPHVEAQVNFVAQLHNSIDSIVVTSFGRGNEYEY
jgi:hypothetical protein